jgi:hypothetical protein
MKTRNVNPTAAAAAAALGLILTVAACSSTNSPSPTPGTDGGGGSTAPTFSNIQAQILTPVCTACHNTGGQAQAGGLDLTSAVAWANLVNAPSSGKAGAVRVVPGDPNNSYLVQKLEGAAGIVGLRMPRNGPPYLTDAQVALVRQWIAAGASND